MFHLKHVVFHSKHYNNLHKYDNNQYKHAVFQVEIGKFHIKRDVFGMRFWDDFAVLLKNLKFSAPTLIRLISHHQLQLASIYNISVFDKWCS
jgi:hypothetical protein